MKFKTYVMPTPKSWTGYSPGFLEDFVIPVPKLGKWEDDLVINNDTGAAELPFIHFSSFQSASRRLPVVTASNIFRDKWVPAGREGEFKKDSRLKDADGQFTPQIYKGINKLQKKSERKMAKGHMVRREDVQWDINKAEAKAIAAAIATFHFTNACPQHQALNNVLWKELENSILKRGRTREPRKAIVFTGPILNERDPFLVIHDVEDVKIRCPLRFWKIVYFVNPDNELRRAAFLMSHKAEVEEDGYVVSVSKFEAVQEKPFLEFDEKEKYQVHTSLIEKLTGLAFTKATEAIAEGQHSRLTVKPPAKSGTRGFESLATNEVIIEGLLL